MCEKVSNQITDNLAVNQANLLWLGDWKNNYRKYKFVPVVTSNAKFKKIIFLNSFQTDLTNVISVDSG